MKKLFLFIVALLCMFTTQSYAKDFLEKDILGQLGLYRDSCIIHVQGDKYYLDLERVSVCKEGMFLRSDFFGLVSLLNLTQDDT